MREMPSAAAQPDPVAEGGINSCASAWVWAITDRLTIADGKIGSDLAVVY